MDNSAIVAAIRERLVSELSNSTASKPKSMFRSVGVSTDNCEMDNNIVRERIRLELAEPKLDKSTLRNSKDVSVQTEVNEENNSNFEHRFIEIERECEKRLRREFNAKLKLSAKKQAMQAMARLDRKCKSECNSFKKQLADERRRSKQQEKELLQKINCQQLSSQKDLKYIQQKFERERLEKRLVESELGKLNDRMKEFQLTRLADNEEKEHAITKSITDHEQQKRQHQIQMAEIVRERDNFEHLLTHESQKTVDLSKKLINTERKLGKTESALDAKTSQVTALRALLRKCQATLESMTYKVETNPCQYEYNPKSLPSIPNNAEKQAVVASAQVLHSGIIDKELSSRPSDSQSESLNDHIIFEKKRLGDPPPCSTLGDPPEEIATQPDQRRAAESPATIGTQSDFCIDQHVSSPVEAVLPHDDEEQSNTEDINHVKPRETYACNETYKPGSNGQKEPEQEIEDEKLFQDNKLQSSNDSPPDHLSCSTVEAESKSQTSRDESSSPIRRDESREIHRSSDVESDTSDDEYSMGSFCTVDQKLDKQGRVTFIHIK